LPAPSIVKERPRTRSCAVLAELVLLRHKSRVIAGPDPAIHFANKMDPRVKPAGDAVRRVIARINDRKRDTD
jgi:hypothetical protein